MSASGCTVCGCTAPSVAHAIVTRLVADDVDGAIDAGLLDAAPCDACAPACSAVMTTARDERVAALAARARFRARAVRLERRAAAREAARAARAIAPGAITPTLPAAAAAVLQRALARAKGRS